MAGPAAQRTAAPGGWSALAALVAAGPAGASTSAVRVAAMVDLEHDRHTGGVVDPVEDPVGATSCGSDAGQMTAQWFVDWWRIGEKGAGEELE